MKRVMDLRYGCVCVLSAIILILFDEALGDPRAQTVDVSCGNVFEHNATIFVPNFVSTMEKISDKMRTQGYGQAITGTGPDTNYGYAQCYGDLSLLDCVLCYAQARTVLPKCFPYNSGRIYLDGCFMRAANYSFFEEYAGAEDKPVCGNKTRKSAAFQQSAKQAVSLAVSAAQSGGGYGKSHLGNGVATNESVHVLADCWNTLNASSCKACLDEATTSILTCLPWSEGRALQTGCFMRYSDTDFLNIVATSRRSSGSVVVIVVSVVSSVLVLAIGAVIALYIWKNRIIQKKRRGSNDVEKLVKTLNDSSLNFKYSTIEKATDSFSDANKLGQGGFGTVYKGVLADGREIAVKRLFFNNRHRAADFYNEVNIISSVDHKNLVRLLGCSCSGPESLLVYEYLPNRSLDRFIFDSTRGKVLTWDKRYEVISGTAEGLVYLHETSKIKIIHRDIKASNILLDLKLRPKIADFGLARSFQEDKSHISTAIAGTLGYMAPEYLAHGQLTEKADVYSFGVLVLEIITGRQNNRSRTAEYTDSIVTLTWKHFQNKTLEDLLDPNLLLQSYHNSNTKTEVTRVLHIALLCTQEFSSLRPAMSKVLEMLRKMDEPLPAPTNPPFLDEGTMELHDSVEHPAFRLKADSSSNSVNDMSHSSFFAR
ncbi:unnamed protein product [Rhodiola kirilowii]